MEEEIWKDIKGYEGLYQVSNSGRVRSLPRIRKTGSNGSTLYRGKILTPSINKRGYKYISIHTKRNSSSKKLLLHRLIAEAFIPNPYALPIINHKDENKQNNDINNLEWCDYTYNNRYGTAKARAQQTKLDNGTIRKVCKYNLDGTLISTYNSITEAAKDNQVLKSSISNCCVNKTIHCKNYAYRFAGEQYIPKQQEYKRNTVYLMRNGNIIYQTLGYKEMAKFLNIPLSTFECICRGKRKSKKLKGTTIKIKNWKDESERIINQ